LVHALRTGSFGASGNFVDNSTSPNDGKEILAYMPGAVLKTIHSSTDPTVDYSNTQYGHNFFVDATPGTGDLFYNGAWHNWLVGGLGPGGAAIYVLDVTNPTPGNFAESNAATLVVGEWTSGTGTGAISCSNGTSCGLNLGNTYGTPQIRRFHNGTWGFVFGNGLGSSTGDAGIFVMTIDPTTQVKTFYYLGTGKSGTADAGWRSNYRLCLCGRPVGQSVAIRPHQQQCQLLGGGLCPALPPRAVNRSPARWLRHPASHRRAHSE
jgi:type IV pilus assembly protein PilY1